MAKRQMMLATHKRIDFAITVTTAQNDNVTIAVKPLLNLTAILMLFWRLTTAISYVMFGFTVLAISIQQSLDTPVKVLQIWLNSWAFGVGLVS